MSPLEAAHPDTVFLGEAVVRIIGAFILLNIFSAGVWCILKGISTHKRMKKLTPVRALTQKSKGLCGASLIWKWKCEEVWAVTPYFFALASREVIPIRVNAMGMQHKLDIWTHNGKGRIIVGCFLCLLAIILAFKLT